MSTVHHERRRAAGILLLALLALTGCRADHSTAAPTASPAASPTVAPSRAMATVTAVPAAVGDMSTLATVAPRSGDYMLTIAVPAGTLHVVLDCVGGKVTLGIKDLGNFPYPCGGPLINTYNTEIDVTSAQQTVISVHPENPDVPWSLRVGSS